VPIKIFDCVQLSVEWWEARRGVPTASGFDRILTPTGKPSAQADDYIAELVGELVDYHPPVLSEKALNPFRPRDNGLIVEPEARAWYTVQTGNAVDQVGFVLDSTGRVGCSPDGMVGDDGCLELKCPLAKTHAKYLMAGRLPPEYKPQVHGQLLVTGRKWVDFMSYAPGLPVILIRVEADDYTQLLSDALEAFVGRYHEAVKKFGLEIPKP
jgi:hypothetical protein